MTRRDLLLMAGYQGVWLVTALSASTAWHWLGPLAALGLVGATALTSLDRKAPVQLAAAGALLGLIAETLLLRLHILDYGAAARAIGLAPLWIITLWAAFAVTLGPLRRMLPGPPLLTAAAFGALFAPLAYLAGARLGALAFPAPGLSGPAAIAVVWGLAMPLLLALDARWNGA